MNYYVIKQHLRLTRIRFATAASQGKGGKMSLIKTSLKTVEQTDGSINTDARKHFVKT